MIVVEVVMVGGDIHWSAVVVRVRKRICPWPAVVICACFSPRILFFNIFIIFVVIIVLRLIFHFLGFSLLFFLCLFQPQR